jgi:hypothetical protein
MERSDDKSNLIKMYRKRLSVWNSRLTDYNYKNKCHHALIEIRISFEIDKYEIKKKIIMYC